MGSTAYARPYLFWVDGTGRITRTESGDADGGVPPPCDLDDAGPGDIVATHGALAPARRRNTPA